MGRRQFTREFKVEAIKWWELQLAEIERLAVK